jgi:hypothetical protein
LDKNDTTTCTILGYAFIELNKSVQWRVIWCIGTTCGIWTYRGIEDVNVSVEGTEWEKKAATK